MAPSFQASAVEFAVSAEESAALHGEKAKTPVIAGAVCGGLMGIAWIIGFSIYFYKRWRRRKERQAGKLPAQEAALTKEKILITPDPAVLSGTHNPGEHAFEGGKPRHSTSSKKKGSNKEPARGHATAQQDGDSSTHALTNT